MVGVEDRCRERDESMNKRIVYRDEKLKHKRTKRESLDLEMGSHGLYSFQRHEPREPLTAQEGLLFSFLTPHLLAQRLG